ncbi:ead/Ea22-like family protein [Escherichia coli]|nr:ead/Ea22-like family protein [Escherichia coli]MBZ8893733.1 ead/Ea22-like family protein [Escherichia coli]HCP2466554.1 ead/Ea22-like family protein [Escherichia coli]
MRMNVFEMEGFLRGKCVPRDLKVNETDAEYLVRKFGELESKLETALRECRSAGITIDNLEAKCAALAAENAGLNKFIAQSCYVFDGEQDELSDAYICATDGGMPQTPATDAFLAEVRAQGVEMLAKNHQSIVNALKGDSLFSDGEYRHAAIVSAAVYFAAELRKGGNQ